MIIFLIVYLLSIPLHWRVATIVMRKMNEKEYDYYHVTNFTWLLFRLCSFVPCFNTVTAVVFLEEAWSEIAPQPLRDWLNKKRKV